MSAKQSHLTVAALCRASRAKITEIVRQICEGGPSSFDLVDVEYGGEPLDAFLALVSGCSPDIRRTISAALGDVLWGYLDSVPGDREDGNESTEPLLAALALSEYLRGLGAVGEADSILDALVHFGRAFQGVVADQARVVLSTWGGSEALSVLSRLYEEAGRPPHHVPELLRARAASAPLKALELGLSGEALEGLVNEPAFVMALETALTAMFDEDSRDAAEAIAGEVSAWPLGARTLVADLLNSDPLSANPYCLEVAAALPAESRDLQSRVHPSNIISDERSDVGAILDGTSAVLARDLISANTLAELGVLNAQLVHSLEIIPFKHQQQSRNFPSAQQAFFRAVREQHGHSFDDAEKLGAIELAFVRSSVQIDDRCRQERRELDPCGVMLGIVSRVRPDVPGKAETAAERLLDAGFKNHYFLMGESEYHEDRLSMPLVESMLKQNGVMGAAVRRRPWESDRFNLRATDRLANVVTRAAWVTNETADGIYKFAGFSVYLRLDALRAHLDTTAGQEVENEAESVFQAAELGLNVEETVDLRTRARLVFHLGLAHAGGSAFEDLKRAVAALAEIPTRIKTSGKHKRNDQAFAEFITGKSAIYCGGSINSLLIETWWRAASPQNFIKILSHDEIALGRSKVGRFPGSPVFVENRLDFNGLTGAHTRQAERAVVDLFRGVGQALETWANEVRSTTGELNGYSDECDAARRLLQPQPTFGSGQYAFVTGPRDPALLLAGSNRYYS